MKFTAGPMKIAGPIDGAHSLFTSEGKQETATFGYRSQGADTPKRFISTSYKPQIFRLRFFDGFFKT